MTARTLAHQARKQKTDVAELEVNEITQKNVDKVTRYRKDGNEKLLAMVERMRGLSVRDRETIDEYEVRGPKIKAMEKRAKERERNQPKHW